MLFSVINAREIDGFFLTLIFLVGFIFKNTETIILSYRFLINEQCLSIKSNNISLNYFFVSFIFFFILFQCFIPTSILFFIERFDHIMQNYFCELQKYTNRILSDSGAIVSIIFCTSSSLLRIVSSYIK